MQITSTHPPAGGVDPQELDRHIAEMYRDVANEGSRELHFPTGRPLAEALGYPAELLERLPAQLQAVERNPAYSFASDRAQRTSDKYGAYSVSLLAVKPVRASRHTPHPDLGGGADVAEAAGGEGSTNTTKTEEVSK
jgi:hypothetical protein